MSDLKLTIRRAVPDDAAAYALILGDDSIHLVAESDNEIFANAMLFGVPQMRRRHACVLAKTVQHD